MPAPAEETTLPILLACARPTLSAEVVARLDVLLSAPFDGPRLLEAAVHHGLTALLHAHLQQHPVLRARLPDDLWQLLVRQAAVVHQRNLALTAALVEVMEALRANGLRALAFKGPTLVQEAYGALGLRPFNDLDLLVARTDVAAVHAVLERLRFTAQPRTCHDEEKARGFVRGGVLIELHHSLSSRSFPWGRADLEAYWPGRTACLVGGRPLATPGLNDLMLYLIVHGGRHHWSSLKWLADVATLHHRHPDFDWATLLAEARARRLLTPVLLAWQLLDTALGIPPPPVVARALERHTLRTRLLRSCRAAWGASPAPKHEALERPLFHFSLLGSWRARARFLQFMLFAPNEEDHAGLRFLPPGTPLIFSLFRPFRLAARYGHRLFGLVRP